MKFESITHPLSIQKARKLALHSQRVLTANRRGKAIDATCEVINHLGYVQIDTISVIQRAHHHTLWVRNPRYRQEHLNQLMQQGRIFEYWSHAAAFLPISDYRFTLPAKREFVNGKRWWYKCDPEIKRQILDRIIQEGPLQSRDFQNHGKKRLSMWQWKPAKIALEQLFMEGQLMVVRRDGFQKVYDLAERVLPDQVDTSMPDKGEFLRHLILRYLKAHGYGSASEIAYLRDGLKPAVQSELMALAENGEIVPVQIPGNKPGAALFALPGYPALLDKPLARSRVRILSPFDNLVIQRKRINALFDYDYQIECYVPAAKRKYGYFCLPVLWDGNLVARMDCKADRPSRTLIVRNIALEGRINRMGAFYAGLTEALTGFMTFNQCDSLALEKIPDPGLRSVLDRTLASVIRH